METRIYHLHVLTALHMGVGQGSGIIDLPIARERATHLPLVPGSAVKGVLREELRPDRLDNDTWQALFGPDSRGITDDNSFAGALVIGDARLLCLPVRSLYGTFAFATCPLVLRRYARDWQVVQAQGLPGTIPEINAANCLISANSLLMDKKDKKIYLEDLDLTANSKADADDWAKWIAEQVFPTDTQWQSLFQERFIILSDAEFDFLAETAMEIRARVKLQEGKRTVAKGALWYEENLPAESILWGLLAADRDFSKPEKEKETRLSAAQLLGKLPTEEQRLQIGGKASIGRGQVRWLLR